MLRRKEKERKGKKRKEKEILPWRLERKKERKENLTVMEEAGKVSGSDNDGEIGIRRQKAEKEIPAYGLGLADAVRGYFPGKKQDIRTYSPLTLAYVGDAVYDLIIRTIVVERANRPANELHRCTIKYVSANAQSKIVQALMEDLTEEEQAVFRRGRNAKPHTIAKNASVADYMRATGFEAVLGYLYLTDNMQRVLELVKKGAALIEELS